VNIKIRHLFAALLVAVVTGGLVAASAVRSASTPKPISLKTVSLDVLEAHGTSLTEPENPSASVSSSASRESAEAAARGAFGPTAVVRESRFAHCVYGPVNQDCWVISLDSSVVPYLGPELKRPADFNPTFFVVYVDPVTNKVLGGEAG
jgi:hypothetical protein